jgi:hypothetical protein
MWCPTPLLNPGRSVEEVERRGRIDRTHASGMPGETSFYGYVSSGTETDQNTVGEILWSYFLDDVMEIIDPRSIEYLTPATPVDLRSLAVST